MNEENYSIDPSLLQRYEEAQQQGRTIFLDADEYLDICEYYQHKDLYDNALEALNQGLSIFPQSTTLLCMKARWEINFNEPAHIAEAEFLISQVEDKEHEDYVLTKAEILLVKGETETANSLLETHYQEMDEDQQEDFVYDTVVLLSDYSQHEAAKAWYLRMKDTDNTDCMELKLRIQMNERDYKKAEETIQLLLDKNPFSPDYWVKAAQINVFSYKYDEALECCDYALAIDGTHLETLFCKGIILIQQGKAAETLKLVAQLITLIPNRAEPYILGAKACVLTQDASQGRKYLDKAIDLYNTRPELHEEIVTTEAELCFIRQEYDKALSFLNTLNITSVSDPIDILLKKANCLINMNRLQESLLCIRDAISMENFPETFFMAGVLYFQHQLYAIAEDLLKHYVSVTADPSLGGHAYLAECYRQRGDTDNFLKHLEQACIFNTKEAELVFSDFFPSEVKPEFYYQYYIDHRSEMQV